jgi:hypothetical protein
MLHFFHNITCNQIDSQCADMINNKIKDYLPNYNSNTGHLSIHHTQKNHEIFFFLYNNNKHESHSRGKIITRTFEGKQKKYTGKIPTEKEFKKLLE